MISVLWSNLLLPLIKSRFQPRNPPKQKNSQRKRKRRRRTLTSLESNTPRSRISANGTLRLSLSQI